MIYLNSLHKLIFKLGENATTELDYVANFDRLFVRREPGTASIVGTPEIATGTSSDTTNVVIIDGSAYTEQLGLQTLFIVNRDNVVHTIYVSVLVIASSTERRLIHGVTLPIGGTLVLNGDGSFGVYV